MDGRRVASGRYLPWLVVLVLFVVTLPTAPEVLDFDAVHGSLLVVVAAAAALPAILIASRLAPVGWLVSMGSALLVSRTIPVLDGDPWPWPTVHGLVLLAFVFAIAMRPPPDLTRAQRRATVFVVWLGTATLFAVSVPDRLRAGWVVGVTAAVVIGSLVRWLGWLGRLDATTPTAQNTREDALLARRRVTDALLGFREAYLSWVPSPPLGPPLARRLLDRFSWGAWLRAALPWVLAVGVFWIGIASIHETLLVHDLALPFYAALIALPVGLARQHALLGWRLATVLAIVVAVVGTPSDGQDPGTWPVIQQWAWLAVTFLASARHGRWTTIWVWIATVAALSAGTVDNSGTTITMIVAVTAAAMIGDLLRTRRLASQEVERQTELSELEKARRTVLEERTRIARDLHDVVAHHMSMVVVQAETAPYRLPDLPDAAKAEFTAVSTSARQALTEIRSMLGVLRSPDQDIATAPQPGLEQLDELVVSAERSGVDVTLTTSGTPVPLGTAPGLSAYRIVQESLANAARHAPGASVTVRVNHTEETVELVITNPPPPVPVESGPPGHGLIGMRERATVVGGSLRAEPSPGGGFTVSATIPRAAQDRVTPDHVTPDHVTPDRVTPDRDDTDHDAEDTLEEHARER